MQKSPFQILFLLVQLATIAVFLGRGWQHLYWDAPYRVLLWDENWLKPLVEGIFHTPWETYVTSLAVDRGVQYFIRATGLFYLFCAVAALLIRTWNSVAVVVLYIGAASLFLLALLYCKEKFYHVGQLLEYTLQWSSPLFLIALHREKIHFQSVMLGIKIAVALTFVCHGLYAVGYYPRPGEFLQMTMLLLQTDETATVLFLKIVGILDFVAGVLLFLPNRIGRLALWYCVMWGLATTLARIATPIVMGVSFSTLVLQWLHEGVYRFPHFLLPLGAALAFKWQEYPKCAANQD